MKVLLFNYKLYSICSLICLIVLITNALYAQSKGNTLSKNRHNTFKITPQDKLTITNSFGQVKINTWEKNEIEVDVTIKTWAKTENEARDILDKITIDEKRKEKEIFYETKIVKKFKNSKHSGFEINYEVNMPQYTALNLDNRFGAIYLGDHSGEISLLSAYGSLNAKKLSGSNVNIQVSYGQATIDEINNGNVKSSYCNFVEIGKAGNLIVDDRNGKLEIEQANSVTAQSAYSHFSIGQLKSKLILDSKFGSANIGDVSSNIEKIEIDIDYGSVSLDLREVPNFNFEVDASFGSFNSGLSGMSYSSKIERPTQKSYEGKRGNGGNHQIKINSSYGSVRFK